MNNQIFGLTCNHIINPMGIDSRPAFSWKYSPDLGSQQAYRVSVASSRENLDSGNFDCWDSGRIESNQSHFIEYDGTPLHPRTAYRWSVSVWGEGETALTSHAAFETGKRDERWSARWISADHHKKQDDSLDAPYLRKTFSTQTKPTRARLYICSPGYFDAYINGKRVSDEELPTPFTRYDARLLYSTYDPNKPSKARRERDRRPHRQRMV